MSRRRAPSGLRALSEGRATIVRQPTSGALEKKEKSDAIDVTDAYVKVEAADKWRRATSNENDRRHKL